MKYLTARTAYRSVYGLLWAVSLSIIAMWSLGIWTKGMAEQALGGAMFAVATLLLARASCLWLRHTRKSASPYFMAALGFAIAGAVLMLIGTIRESAQSRDQGSEERKILVPANSEEFR